MKEFCHRLTRGADLKESIEGICRDNGFDTAVVLSAVGCLSKTHVRLAKAINEVEVEEDFEIVSLTGTVSKGEAHLHISLSDEIGNVFGGHLKEGCIVNTTCELVLGVLEEYGSKREFDRETGYDEIIFEKEIDHD
ncbi:MAG: DNA-binding protein [Erysipelotrichaceae bacterium]|nr:DNA-binding protein [Erysipelotrichaceae bacterium]